MPTTRPDRRRPAFTLIELLVVVAIIALLISILLPTLNGARKQGKAVKCAANMHSLGQAFATYLAENNAVYPPSYVAPASDQGSWGITPADQSPAAQFGYLHWSHLIYRGGDVNPGTFQCPEFPKGGAPRTNPGARPEDWEGGQRDEAGGAAPAGLATGLREDRQAPRMAYTTNAAIVPQNKFTTDLSRGPRFTQLVSESRLRSSRQVILATEFLGSWRALADGSPGALVSRSHLPIHPFHSGSATTNEFAIPEPSDLRYGVPNSDTYGLRTRHELEDATNVIGGAHGPLVNAVARHHPGNDKLGGSANFLYIDGSASRKPILQTLRNREWGHAFWSVVGQPEVIEDENSPQ